MKFIQSRWLPSQFGLCINYKKYLTTSLKEGILGPIHDKVKIRSCYKVLIRSGFLLFKAASSLKDVIVGPSHYKVKILFQGFDKVLLNNWISLGFVIIKWHWGAGFVDKLVCSKHWSIDMTFWSRTFLKVEFAAC